MRLHPTSALLALLSACAVDPGPAPPRRIDASPQLDASREPDAPAIDSGSDADPWPHVDPFVVDVRPTALQVRAGGSAELAILVSRAPGFETPIEIAASGLPRGTDASFVVAAPGEDVIAMRIDAAQHALTEHPVPFAISASADGVQHNLRITIEVVP